MQTATTSREETIIDELPATTNQLSDQLDVTSSTVRDYVSNIRQKGYSIGTRDSSNGSEYYLREEEAEHPSSKNVRRSEQTRHKHGKTKTLNQNLRGMESRLVDILDNTEPASTDHPVTPSHEDVVIHRTDAHFGDRLTDEFGNVVFDSEIAAERERTVTRETMQLVERQRQAGMVFDTAHLLLGGDHVTGEQIYQNQQAEIVETLDEQIDLAVEVYIEQIELLADEFDAVQVVCQTGNHGDLGASYSNGANADRMVYMMLDAMVRRDPNLDNVTFIQNDSTEFTNFYVRGDKESYVEDNDGWRFHLRHGDSSMEHIGTSAGKRRWYNWLLRHEFDQGYRGHYHQFEIDTVHGDTKVIMTGSPKPPDEFEERIAEWTTPTATIHGVSDSRPMTWMFPVSFD